MPSRPWSWRSVVSARWFASRSSRRPSSSATRRSWAARVWSTTRWRDVRSITWPTMLMIPPSAYPVIRPTRSRSMRRFPAEGDQRADEEGSTRGEPDEVLAGPPGHEQDDGHREHADEGHRVVGQALAARSRRHRGSPTKPSRANTPARADSHPSGTRVATNRSPRKTVRDRHARPVAAMGVAEDEVDHGRGEGEHGGDDRCHEEASSHLPRLRPAQHFIGLDLDGRPARAGRPPGPNPRLSQRGMPRGKLDGGTIAPCVPRGPYRSRLVVRRGAGSRRAAGRSSGREVEEGPVLGARDRHDADDRRPRDRPVDVREVPLLVVVAPVVAEPVQVDRRDEERPRVVAVVAVARGAQPRDPVGAVDEALRRERCRARSRRPVGDRRPRSRRASGGR